MRVLLPLLMSIAAIAHVLGDDHSGLAVTEFQRRLATNRAATFEAWNGKPECFDCETNLVFLPDRRVYMLEFGYALTIYVGTYDLSNGGKVKAHFQNFHGSWPAMLLQRDGKSLLLAPADPNVGFIMGGRGGVTFTHGTAGYWPFRIVSNKQEKAALKLLKQRQPTRR